MFMLVCVASAMLLNQPRPCSDKVEVYIGWLATLNARSRISAMQRLSAEIQKCPKAKRYVLYWRIAIDHKAGCAIQYFRDRKGKGRILELEENGNVWHLWTNVSDEAINAVAAKMGTFSDLLTYGARGPDCCG